MNHYRIAMAVLALVLLGACRADDGAGSAPAGDAALAAAGTTGAATAAVVANGVTVSGTGRISGRPDTLTATVGVEVVEESVGAALSGATRAADDLLAALRDAGVAEEDIQTADVSLRPQYGEPSPQAAAQPTIDAYVASNVLRVQLRDLDGAGEVLQQAVAAAGDAARIQGLGFELQDNAALLEEARAAAFAEARAKAEQYAALADAALGGLTGVTEGVATPPPVTSFAAGDVAAAESAEAIPVAPGQQEVSVTVTATWQLE